MIKPAVIKPVIAPAIPVPVPVPRPAPAPAPVPKLVPQPPATPVKKGGDIADDGYGSDDETVINDKFTP